MYAKVFRSLWDGTLGPDWVTWSVFVFILAHADREGFVEITPQAISARSGIPLESVRKALLKLESPDSESRSSDQDGRRLERIDEHRSWGWRVVNYLKYREMRDEEDRREQNRRAQRKRRGQPQSASVSQSQPRSAHADVEAENLTPFVNGDALTGGNGHQPGDHVSVREWFEVAFWPRYPRKVGKAAALRRISALFKRTPRAREDDLANAILSTLDDRIAGEWQGREPDKIPHASTFLNAEAFDAQPATP